MLNAERQFFEEKRKEWLTAYQGRYVVVKDRQLLGVFNTEEEAIAAGTCQFGLEPFLVRQVQPAEQEVCIPVLMLGLLGADPQLSPHTPI